MNNEWERFGDEIKRTIQDAVDSQDFSRLNQTITNTVNMAMENVSRGLKNGGWYRKPSQNYGTDQRQHQNAGSERYNYDYKEVNTPNTGKTQNRQGSGTMQPPAPVKPRYLKATAPKIGGVFLAVTGGIFGVGTLIFLLFMIIGLAVTTIDLAGGIVTGVFAVVLALFIGMTATGINMVGSVSRFRKYVSIIQEREFCDIKEIAEKTGRNAKTVLKDVKKMIRKGWFCQGHLDEKESCLIVSDDAWNQYTSLMDHLHQEKAEQEAAAERVRQQYESLSPEVQKIVEAGDEYVKRIHEANDKIPGVEISAKISRMELLVDRIFDRVEQNPDSVEDIRKLMDYYLPTTMKLLEAYEELDAQPIQGENIVSSKKEIESTLDTLNVAFEKLLDELFQDTAWDLSSDISVLHTMLAQEGLTEDGLKKRK